MTVGPLRVALEGPSCAGKTTFAGHLAYAWNGSVSLVPDYSAVVGRWGEFRSDMPPAPSLSVEMEDEALRRLLGFERERFAGVSGASLVIIDRSVYSLVAHCTGLDRAQGVDRYERHAIEVTGASDAVVWPTHIIYVDVATDVQRARYGSRTPPLFADPVYNAGIKEHFERLEAVGSIPILWLDAASSETARVDQAVAFLFDDQDRDTPLGPSAPPNRRSNS